MIAPDKPNIQVLRVTEEQWTEENRRRWLRCELIASKSFGPTLDDRVVVYHTRDDDERALKLEKNPCVYG